MPIKISQLPALTVIDGTVVLPVIDVSGTPISKKATASTLATYILAGNAATATKLATARTINGVSFDGTANISITAALPTATTSVKGGVIAGSGINVAVDGTISVATIGVATTSVAGTVIVGSGINVAVDGTISTVPAPAKLFHGFSIDANSNLIYSTTSDSSISLQNQYGADIYEDTDIGTADYAYSMDANGNLIVTYS
jgi:hypothetical protein